MDTDRERWLAEHPYLGRLAAFEEAVERAAAGAGATAAPPAPGAWDADRAKGIPLLRSAAAGVDVIGPAAANLGVLAGVLSKGSVPESLGAACRALGGRLASDADRGAAIRWVLGDESVAALPEAGLLRLLGWNAIARAAAPAVAAAAPAFELDRWGHGYCPTCGAPPAVAQLAGPAEMRQRTLACGVCRTRWPWRRLGCPFCGNDAPERIDLLVPEGEPALRIDGCRECSGYLKTYVGEGHEALLLADWSTIHLDVLADERGFRRKGASLYEL